MQVLCSVYSVETVYSFRGIGFSFYTGNFLFTGDLLLFLNS